MTPGAARVGDLKKEFNLRVNNGASVSGAAVEANLGWNGAESYVATVPRIFDLLADLQERHDIFINNITEDIWYLAVINQQITDPLNTYVQQYPPRKL